MFCMPPQQCGVSVTMPSTGPIGSHCQNKTWAEPIAMELIGLDSMHSNIKDLYQDMYQLWKLPRRGQCEEAMEECLCLEVLDSIKECLWLKWPSTKPDVEQKQLLADLYTEFAAANHNTCEKSTTMKQDSYEEMMALVRVVH